jgi:uroporphyrinogen-III synthase
VGLAPSVVAGAPTTDGVIASLRHESLRGTTAGVQLYAEDNPPLLQYLREAGAEARTVLPYVYAPDTDTGRVADLIAGLADGSVQGLVITSSPQAERLFEVAGERGIEDALRAGLARACVAAVGPVAADALRRHGVAVSVCPDQGWVMKNLVQQVVRWREQRRT